MGQASWTQVPQTCLRASCRGVTGRPQRPQRSPAARAALPSHPAGSAPTQLSPIGPEPVTGNPRPPGQKCSRCAWRTRSPTGTRSRPCPDAFRPARPALRTTGSPWPPPRRSRSAILILSSPVRRVALLTAGPAATLPTRRMQLLRAAARISHFGFQAHRPKGGHGRVRITRSGEWGHRSVPHL